MNEIEILQQDISYLTKKIKETLENVAEYKKNYCETLSTLKENDPIKLCLSYLLSMIILDNRKNDHKIELYKKIISLEILTKGEIQ